MARVIFFEKDKKSAIKRLTKLNKMNELTLTDKRKFNKGLRPKLAKKQIKHIAGWKTWEY